MNNNLSNLTPEQLEELKQNIEAEKSRRRNDRTEQLYALVADATDDELKDLRERILVRLDENWRAKQPPPASTGFPKYSPYEIEKMASL